MTGDDAAVELVMAKVGEVHKELSALPGFWMNMAAELSLSGA